MSAQRVGLSALLAGVLLFSTVEVCSKLMQAGGGVSGNNPFWLAAIRFVAAGLVLLVPARRSLISRRVDLHRRDLLILAGLGLTGVTLMASLFHLAIVYLPANIAALVFSCNPVFVVLFAAPLLSEAITARKVGAVLLCLAGVAVLWRDRVDGLSPLGLMLMLAAMLVFALYTVLSKKFIPRYGAPAVTAMASLTGGVLLIPVALTLEGFPLVSYGIADWVGMAYLALFGTALAYLLYLYGIGHVGAGVGSMSFFLKPFAAALFAWLILGETFSTPELLAGVFILCGMVVGLVPRKRRQIAL